MIDKKIFLIFVILFSLNLINASYYYNFDIEYKNGNLDIKSVSVEFSQEENFADNYYNEDNVYFLNIINGKNVVLDKINFSVPNFVLYDMVDEKGEFNESKIVFLEEVEFNVLSNYYENGYKAILYDNSGKDIASILLSQFSKEGFNIQDFVNNKIDKEVSLKDVEKIAVQKKDYTNYVKILLIVLVILIIILIVILKKKI